MEEMGQNGFISQWSQCSVSRGCTTAQSYRRPMHPMDLFQLRVVAPVSDEMAGILAPEALLFLEELEAEFGERRKEILRTRAVRAAEIARGAKPDFLESTSAIRVSNWKVAPNPDDLLDRRVEIVGPAERLGMIKALNSGARVFVADFEDTLSPTWRNVITGQAALWDAVRRTLNFRSVDGRKNHGLNERTATLAVRPRGWHLEERGLRFDGDPVSASLVDFGLYFYHNARELMHRGSGPYFHLPKIESHFEARLWNDVFNFAQDRLGIPRGTIRATVSIETLSAAFEMDEILFELREHATGLSMGRRNYLFSLIKSSLLANAKKVIFPDRAQLAMTAPFMRAHAKLLVATCHRRGAHAIGGGMAAFVGDPARADEVRADQEREASDGFDGTCVAHPELVPFADEIFTARLGSRPHQKSVEAVDGFTVTSRDLLPSAIEEGKVTDAGVGDNIAVVLRILSSWLQGKGTVVVHDVMEDVATAEIARAELWQWVKLEVSSIEGVKLTRAEFLRRLESERARFAGSAERGRINEACALLEKLVLSEELQEFLTLPAYEILEPRTRA